MRIKKLALNFLLFIFSFLTNQTFIKNKKKEIKAFMKFKINLTKTNHTINNLNYSELNFTVKLLIFTEFNFLTETDQISK